MKQYTMWIKGVDFGIYPAPDVARALSDFEAQSGMNGWEHTVTVRLEAQDVGTYYYDGRRYQEAA